MTPPISVAMNLHNSMRYIDKTMESLLAQSWIDFEAILVDDGSTDGTAEHIALHYPDPRLRIIRQSNRGMGPARAVSVSHARGQYVAFLDHDDVWLANKLERQMAMAAQNPDAGLIFSDCLLIDSNDRVLGAMSERYEYSQIDLRAGYAHDEFLRRGCFVAMSTAIVKMQALKKLGGPNQKLGYGDDYDMWLRLSRNLPVLFVDEKLAKWRLHQTSMTENHPEISARGHARIWGPIVHNHTYPVVLRTTVGDHLFGQQRCAIQHLIRQRRWAHAVKICAEMAKEPAPILRFVKHLIKHSAFKHLFLVPFRLIRWGHKTISSGNRLTWNLLLRMKDFVWTLPKRIRGESWSTRRPTPESEGTHVWMDGTSLTAFQTGYCNFVCETIRSLVQDKRVFTVHVTVPPGGESILRKRLGMNMDASRLRFHRAGSELLRPKVHRRSNRFVRYLAKLISGMSRPFPPETTAEIVIWRGRFRFADSRKIAVIHDVTARLLPELHTADNVAEFAEFVRYAQDHADMIATVSEHSRRDIVEHLDVRPNSVRVVLSQIHPVYFRPKFDRQVPTLHSLAQPYLLCVGTIEPRKNLRRLVEAFSLLQRAGALQKYVLALAGPQGWDDTFDQFLIESDAYPRVRRLGFVPLEHMPSLYHFASTVIYPSIYEGFGLPVLEALCSSANVITSNVTSLAEIAGSVVKTFNPFEPLSIAEALLAASVMQRDARIAYRRQCRVRGKQLLRESAGRPSMATLLANRLTEESCALPSFSHSSI